ncbi:tetratricopeptide repeat-containing protein [Cystoisospora suis]|uniref:Tetratricopeptide repeat-containing protein n=1 Tax=Cystoisospora suis TaxID=483139 RepID=A0A2C6LA84_9APIC|nr:tetratricopeptide repeat-containing protein [Cystoisospora suis]
MQQFYRGRHFLAQLLYTIDNIGGLWVYLIPRLKSQQTDDKSGKGPAKHAKAPPPARGKAGNRVDVQSASEICRRFAGRAWVPLDPLKEEPYTELEGTYQLLSFDAASIQDDTARSTAPESVGGKKTELPSPAVDGGTAEALENAGTCLKLRIKLKERTFPLVYSQFKEWMWFSLRPLQPRSFPVLQQGYSEDLETTPSAPDDASAQHTPSDKGSTTTWSALPSKASLNEFRSCVEKGIRWIAAELSSALPPEKQHLLAAAMTSVGASAPVDVTEGVATEEAARSLLLEQLKHSGCYDELQRRIRKSVTMVLRDKLRKDVALTAAATKARRGDEPQALSESMLQQRLDKFLSDTFVFLVDTMQTMVNEKVMHCHNLREKADVFYTGPAVPRVPGKDECAAAAAPEDDSCLARLSFEAEIIGDMERSVRLQKCRLLSESGKDNADRWYELARLLMRAGEVHVEEAEEALWKSISLQGGPEKASPEVMLMLGSCLLHRRRYQQAKSAISHAVKLCERPRDAESFSTEDRQEILTAQPEMLDRSRRQSADEGVAPPAQILPLFFLSISHYLSGDRLNFEKYLALTLKPAIYFKLGDMNETENAEALQALQEPEEERTTSDDKATVAQPPVTWADGSFDELEQMLPVFPRNTFYEPATIDYPILAFLLMLLKFGFSSLCLSFIDCVDFVHSDTRQSGLFAYIKAKALFLKKGESTRAAVSSVTRALLQQNLGLVFRTLERKLAREDAAFCCALLVFVRSNLYSPDFLGAAKELHTILRSNPRHREALPLLAECYARVGAVRSALRFFQQSVDFLDEPQDCVLFLRLGELMLKRKYVLLLTRRKCRSYQEAHLFYRRSLEKSVTSEGWLGVAISLYRLEQLPAALEAATVSNWHDRERGETWGYLALCLLSMGKEGEANLCTRFMIKKGLRNTGVAALGGAVTVNRGIKMDPDQPYSEVTTTAYTDWGGGLLVEVAHAYQSRRDHEGTETAEALAREALREDQGNAAARKVLAEALAAQGQVEAAAAELIDVMSWIVTQFKDEQSRALRIVSELSGTDDDIKSPGAQDTEDFNQNKENVAKMLTEAFELGCACLRQLDRPLEDSALWRMYKQKTRELASATQKSLRPGEMTDRELESDL